MKEKADIAVKNGILITMDKDRRIFRGSLAIKGDKIIAVGKTDDVDSKYSADKVINASKMVILPGMANMHNHIWASTISGLRATEGMKIDELLRTSWRMQESMDRDQFYWGAMLTCLQNIKGGTTAIAEHCYPFHRLAAAESTFQALEDSGIRGAYGRGIMTKGYEPICESHDKAFAATEALIQRARGKRTQVMIAPVSFRQSGPEDYHKARELANKYRVRLYTHVAETPMEAEMTLKEYNKRPIEALHEFGFTGRDATLVHTVYVSDNELKILRESGCSTVHCPSNHMKLAKGVTPVPKLLKAGIPVSLGTDAPTTGKQDMIAEMSMEIHLQSISNMDPSVINPMQVLEMATINGAIALGMGDSLGSLEVGKKADLFTINLDKPHLKPLIDVTQTVVYFANASDVDTTIIDGKIVMESRRVLSMDEEKVVASAEKASREYVDRIGMQHLVGKY